MLYATMRIGNNCEYFLFQSAIKIRFNRLCEQFENNPKYIPNTEPDKEQTIPDDEHLSYEMGVNNKRYAAFIHNFRTPLPRNKHWVI